MAAHENSSRQIVMNNFQLRVVRVSVFKAFQNKEESARVTLGYEICVGRTAHFYP